VRSLSLKNLNYHIDSIEFKMSTMFIQAVKLWNQEPQTQSWIIIESDLHKNTVHVAQTNDGDLCVL
jgi:hypothetical protein